MSPFPYDQLWHFSEKFTRDPDLRQDLALMAWKEDERLANRSDVRLLKNFMKFRAKEIHFRNSLGSTIGGKKRSDVCNHDRVSIFKPITNRSHFCIADTLTSVERNPLSHCIVNDFEEALLAPEEKVAQQIIAGYTDKEGAGRLRVPMVKYRLLKDAVREKAMEYLM
jgi:hypothetical protein